LSTIAYKSAAAKKNRGNFSANESSTRMTPLLEQAP